MSAIRCPRNFRSQSRSNWPKESPPYYDYPSAAHRRSYARRMSAESGGRVIATARYSENAAADGHGAWIVSDHPSRLFTRNQAITAMVLAERLAAGAALRSPVSFARDELVTVTVREVHDGGLPSGAGRGRRDADFILIV